jgi:hypothetical protein
MITSFNHHGIVKLKYLSNHTIGSNTVSRSHTYWANIFAGSPLSSIAKPFLTRLIKMAAPQSIPSTRHTLEPVATTDLWSRDASGMMPALPYLSDSRVTGNFGISMGA